MTTTPNKEKCTRSIYLRCTQSLWRAIAQAALNKEQSRTQFIIEALEKELNVINSAKENIDIVYNP